MVPIQEILDSHNHFAETFNFHKYDKQDDGSWKKLKPKPKTVALKRLNGSQNMSADYLNEVFHITFILYIGDILHLILIYQFI